MKNQYTERAEGWSQLSDTCAHCIEQAQELGARLQRGATGRELLSLLQQSVGQVRQLQEGIRRLSGRAGGEAQRGRLAGQMRRLLDLAEHNRALLGSRGIPLNPPRPYRYPPRHPSRR